MCLRRWCEREKRWKAQIKHKHEGKATAPDTGNKRNDEGGSDVIVSIGGAGQLKLKSSTLSSLVTVWTSIATQTDNSSIHNYFKLEKVQSGATCCQCKFDTAKLFLTFSFKLPKVSKLYILGFKTKTYRKFYPIDINKSCLIYVQMVDLAVIVAFNGQADVTHSKINSTPIVWNWTLFLSWYNSHGFQVRSTLWTVLIFLQDHNKTYNWKMSQWLC